MNVIEFLDTIYLGDRGCKSILIDSWNLEIRLQVTCISRVRSDNWNYYDKEDIPDGFLIFENAKGILFEPSGLIPNDLINDIRARALADHESQYLIEINISSVNSTGIRTEMLIHIYADSMALEDPKRPGHRITR